MGVAPSTNIKKANWRDYTEVNHLPCMQLTQVKSPDGPRVLTGVAMRCGFRNKLSIVTINILLTIFIITIKKCSQVVKYLFKYFIIVYPFHKNKPEIVATKALY